MRPLRTILMLLLIAGALLAVYMRKSPLALPSTLELTLAGPVEQDVVQVFYDRGRGFNEPDSLSREVGRTGQSGPETVEFPLPGRTLKGLRIDPGVRVGKKLTITSICMADLLRRECWGPSEIERDFRPLSDITYFKATGGSFGLETSGRDPYFVYAWQDLSAHQSRLRKSALYLTVLGVAAGWLMLRRARSKGKAEAYGPRGYGSVGYGQAGLVSRTVKFAAFVAVALLVMAGVLEVALAVLLHWPSAAGVMPSGLKGMLRGIYMVRSRPIVQYMPECAQYDEDLFYTLKPRANCRFKSTEFDTVIETNSLGLRDDERSLGSPEVIVLGDSLAMGWGVGNEDTFAQILERRTGMKTLNAATSSYGTARELFLLSRLDLSGVRYLVIQYCNNDYEENVQYIEEGFDHKARGREAYNAIVEGEAERRKYTFGGNVSYWLGRVANRRPASPPPGAGAEAEAFLKVLVNMVDPSRFDRILVTEINSYNAKGEFVNALKLALESSQHSHLAGRVVPMDSSEYLAREHFYKLDDHMNTRGHEAVAEALARYITRHNAESAPAETEPALPAKKGKR